MIDQRSSAQWPDCRYFGQISNRGDEKHNLKIVLRGGQKSIAAFFSSEMKIVEKFFDRKLKISKCEKINFLIINSWIRKQKE